MILLLQLAAWLLLAYYGAASLIYAILLVQSILATREHRRRLVSLRHDRSLDGPLSPPISILVPARNEQAGIVESVTSLLALDYPEI
jgi:cellulose synthase/poly-beta-1,6-N-acetylglucosamine synthase-like glycosyltransferase